MIYCVGNRFQYEKAFAAGPVVKQGRGVGADGRLYPGGWVWRTVAEAERFITVNGLNATHRVYGVLADWQRDAVESEGEATRRLGRDAKIVRLTE